MTETTFFGVKQLEVSGFYSVISVRDKVTAPWSRSLRHTSVKRGSIINPMAKVARGPDERTILWSYASTEFRS